MTTAKEQFAQLAALAQLYLRQENALGERIYADAATFKYFVENTPRQSERKVPAAPVSQAAAAASRTPPSPASAAISASPTRSPKIIATSPEVVPADKPMPASQQAPTPTTNEIPSPTRFGLEAPSPVETANFKDIRKILSECRPSLKILDSVPNGVEATSAELLQAFEYIQVAILSIKTSHPKQQAFFENLNKALQTYGWNSKVLEARAIDRWTGWDKFFKAPNLKLIIASDSQFTPFPELKKHCSPNTSLSGIHLGGIPLIVLQDAALYFKDYSLKRQLWQTIRDNLALP